MPLLFSYGTLQQAEVQISTFGRLLQGQPDELVGFEQSVQTIEDPAFVAASGKAEHAIVTYNGRDDSRVNGMVFEVSDSELSSADHYEPAGYTRVPARLASGKHAWVYAGRHHQEVRDGARVMMGRDSRPESAARWELWRLDDNGNRILIRAFADRSAAEADLARFEALHHKQTYWLQQSAGGASRETPA